MAKRARAARDRAAVIRAQTIWTLFRSVLDPAGTRQIVWTAPVGRYIRGGSGAVAAFANVLNRSPQFSGYGLALVPGDLANVSEIQEVGAAVIAWFQRNGWKVVL